MLQDTAITPRSVKLAPSSPPYRQLSKTALKSFENAESCISPFLQDKVRSHSNYAMLSCAYYHLTCLYESTLKKNTLQLQVLLKSKVLHSNFFHLSCVWPCPMHISCCPCMNLYFSKATWHSQAIWKCTAHYATLSHAHTQPIFSNRYFRRSQGQSGFSYYGAVVPHARNTWLLLCRLLSKWPDTTITSSSNISCFCNTWKVKDERQHVMLSHACTFGCPQSEISRNWRNRTLEGDTYIPKEHVWTVFSKIRW